MTAAVFHVEQKRGRGRPASGKFRTPFSQRLTEIIAAHNMARQPIEVALGIRYGQLAAYVTGFASVSPKRMLAIVDALPEISEEERRSLHWAGAVTLGFEIGPDPTPRAGDFQI